MIHLVSFLHHTFFAFRHPSVVVRAVKCPEFYGHQSETRLVHRCWGVVKWSRKLFLCPAVVYEVCLRKFALESLRNVHHVMTYDPKRLVIFVTKHCKERTQRRFLWGNGRRSQKSEVNGKILRTVDHFKAAYCHTTDKTTSTSMFSSTIILPLTSSVHMFIHTWVILPSCAISCHSTVSSVYVFCLIAWQLPTYWPLSSTARTTAISSPPAKLTHVNHCRIVK